VALDPDFLFQLRQLISEPPSSTTWTDARIEGMGPLALLPDGSYDMNKYASVIWDAKAADMVELVKVSESGSSRDMQQAFEHAVKMAERFRAPAGEEGSAAPLAPRSVTIVRPPRGARQ
jgi:hypothetical protein